MMLCWAVTTLALYGMFDDFSLKGASVSKQLSYTTTSLQLLSTYDRDYDEKRGQPSGLCGKLRFGTTKFVQIASSHSSALPLKVFLHAAVFDGRM
eukprot:1162026-Pelagomonas_calceolata.AAC.4